MNLKSITILISFLLITINISVLGLGNLEKNNFTTNEFYYNIKSNTASIKIGPYPQKADFDTTIIVWETSIETQNNSVQFGLTPNCNNTIYSYNNFAIPGLVICYADYFWNVRGLESREYNNHNRF